MVKDAASGILRKSAQPFSTMTSTNPPAFPVYLKRIERGGGGRVYVERVWYEELPDGAEADDYEVMNSIAEAVRFGQALEKCTVAEKKNRKAMGRIYFRISKKNQFKWFGFHTALRNVGKL